MDWKTFIVEILNAVSWPVATVIGVWLFRKPIYDLIPLIRKLKYKEFEMEFSEKVRELKKESEKALPTDESQSPGLVENKSKYFQLLDISPRSAVLEAWLELETAMVDNINRHGLVKHEGILRGHSRLGHVLLNENIINKAQFDLFHKLRDLRNRAAHAEEFELGREDAEYYIDSAVLLSSHLRNN